MSGESYDCDYLWLGDIPMAGAHLYFELPLSSSSSFFYAILIYFDISAMVILVDPPPGQKYS